ncbi:MULTISPECIES: methyl-accepting chemotaxis protein [unclassified Rhizobium]|uniref:methyl-accepting chemotaxis protein n=1 Tax=unclassified Rhizobium TaxID=2613769 RepID=UPI001FCD3FAE|nr:MULTISPECIES: methyl-accepting chemotaxis protein [unclassified Rhizobium]
MFITMLSTAAFNWLQVGIGDDATNDALKRSRIMRGIDALMASMIDQETGIRGYLVSGNEDFLAPYRSGQTRLEDQQRALRTEWINSADQVARLDAFVGLASKWRNDVAEAEIKLMQQKTTQADARALESSGAGKASMDAMRAKAGEMTDVAQARLVTALAAQDAAVATSYATLLMASAASLVLALICATLLIVSIAKPIRRMTSFMERLAGGDTSNEVPGRGRRDEVGDMAQAVEVFRQSAIANRQLEAEAEAARQQAEADRIRLTAEAEAAAQVRLTEATAGLARGLQRLAAGDLSFQLNEPFAPDFEALRHDLNGAVEQLANTLRSVAQATGSIDSGSQEISRGADDLSKRTEQQAASLEETAAALDQITVNVSNSSKRADEARSVALQANASASESGRVVAKAVEAMGKIETSSSEVSNIIGVIDEIAFQTNLLALNAGVEAARAGDAGKGFAVVAQEVRELAQRSAKAAKEIKELIRNSSVEVQNGVKLVSETGQALQTIESYIVTINQHMDSIATSAREQSVGLGEVNTAVNQMDQVTQQNAAMVEETSAAGATLADESGKLRHLIGQFNLGGLGAQPATLRHMAAAMGATQQSARPSAPAAALPMRKGVKAAAGNAAVKESWEEF